jgi:cyclophilin family peptidyl-prolyl cis-trans isomerase
MGGNGTRAEARGQRPLPGPAELRHAGACINVRRDKPAVTDMRHLALIVLSAMMAGTLHAEGEPVPLFPKIALETNKGTIVVELDGNRAPITVANFVTYVRDGHYDGTIFHRVIPGFVAQGGGYDRDYEERPTRAPIPNESGNGLSNAEGTIAMARQNPPHTATSQFYINLGDNDALDPNPRRWGYTVFGQVVEGMDVLAAIAAVPTGGAGPFGSDVPQAPIIIEKARLLGPE